MTRFLGAVVLAASAAVTAYADSITFNFNALTANEADGTPTTSGTISYVLTQQLQASGCVGCTVTATGAYADTTYNADGNVTGPGTGRGDAAASYTLNNAPTSGGLATSIPDGSATNSTLGGSNVFLGTDNNAATACTSGVCTISLTFTGLTLTSVDSFNYEIFPNINCQVLNSANCGGAKNGAGIYPDQPNLSVTTNIGTATQFGTGGSLYGVTPGLPSPSNDAVKSPVSTDELAPQLIGAWSAANGDSPLTTNVAGATTLNFVDWPAAIGVDRVSLSYDPPNTVPEPSSLLLFFTAVAGAMLAARKTAWKA